MKIDSFLQMFVVKEKKFFPLFKEQGVHVLEAAELMQQLVIEVDEEKRREIYKLVKEQERLNDKVTAAIYEELHSSFVTPFDREDIHVLASCVDSFIDLINDACKRITLYAPVNTHGMELISEVAMKQAHLIKQVLDQLESVRKIPDDIKKLCKEVRHLEGEADQFYEEYITSMFEQETDAIALVKRKSIIQGLEEATDKAKDVAGVIYRVLIKLA